MSNLSPLLAYTDAELTATTHHFTAVTTYIARNELKLCRFHMHTQTP